MSEIKLGEQCEHGTLKRQCLVCELQAALAAAQAEGERLRQYERDYHGMRRCDCGDDEACAYLTRAEKAEARVAELEEENHGLRADLTNLLEGKADEAGANWLKRHQAETEELHRELADLRRALLDGSGEGE